MSKPAPVAPAVVVAAKVALEQVAREARRSRERFLTAAREVKQYKEEMLLRDLDVRQLQGFLERAGVDQSEIDRITKGG